MQKGIKILYLFPSLRKAGPTSGMLALIKYMDRERYDVTVGSLDRLPAGSVSIAPALDELNVRIKPFNIAGWIGLLKGGRVKRFIEEENFDIVHSCGMRPDIVSSAARKKIAISSVREIISGNYRLLCGPVASKALFSVHKQVLEKMDLIITVSHAVEDYLIRQGLDKAKIKCVHNFIDPDWAEDSICEEAYYNDPGGPLMNVGYFGNFIPLKRVDWIIKAVSDILKKHPTNRVILHLAGDGFLRYKLRALARRLGVNDNVRFYGHVSDVAAIMSGLDAVVMASRFEGMPRALMEAMSMGKTCIGPRTGGVAELIEDNITGYLFDADSYEDLVDKLKDVVVDKRFLDPMRIKRHIEDHFDARVGSDKTQRLYESLVEGRGTSDVGCESIKTTDAVKAV